MARLIIEEREREREREREKDNKRGFRRVLSAKGIYNQPISNDRVNGKRGIDERDDAVLYDSSPSHRRGTTWKICLAVPSNAPHALLIILPNRRFTPRVSLFLRYQLIRDFVIVLNKLLILSLISIT